MTGIPFAVDEIDMPPTPGRRWLIVLVMSLAAGLFTSGCGSHGVQNNEPPPVPYQQLMAIGQAYVQAIKKQKRGPRDLAEFRPFLQKQPNGEDLFVAISSGQYVVIWGLGFQDLEGKNTPAGKSGFPIMAYQAKAGEDGKRYVLMHGTQVQLMTNEEFRQASFPKGHKPAS